MEEQDDSYDETWKDDLKTFSIEPPDSQCWMVGVVPDVAFQFLPEATNRRHSHDDESEPKGYSKTAPERVFSSRYGYLEAGFLFEQTNEESLVSLLVGSKSML
jgi:hypothetical protein